VKGLTKCCISSAMDGTDDMWKGSEEGWNVMSEEDEDTDCADGDSHSDC